MSPHFAKLIIVFFLSALVAFLLCYGSKRIRNNDIESKPMLVFTHIFVNTAALWMSIFWSMVIVTGTLRCYEWYSGNNLNEFLKEHLYLAPTIIIFTAGLLLTFINYPMMQKKSDSITK